MKALKRVFYNDASITSDVFRTAYPIYICHSQFKKKKKKKGTDGNESLNKTILKAHPNLDDLKGEGLILFNWSQVTHAQSSGDAGEVGAGISSSSQGMGGGSAPDFYF